MAGRLWPGNVSRRKCAPHCPQRAQTPELVPGAWCDRHRLDSCSRSHSEQHSRQQNVLRTGFQPRGAGVPYSSATDANKPQITPREFLLHKCGGRIGNFADAEGLVKACAAPSSTRGESNRIPCRHRRSAAQRRNAGAAAGGPVQAIALSNAP